MWLRSEAKVTVRDLLGGAARAAGEMPSLDEEGGEATDAGAVSAVDSPQILPSGSSFGDGSVLARGGFGVPLASRSVVTSQV